MPRVHQYIDIIQFGDDLGTQIAPQISPEMYVEMIKPYHKKLYQFIQKNYPMSRSSCIAAEQFYNLIPGWIDAGVQILNPVQISAEGMESGEAEKKNMGKSSYSGEAVPICKTRFRNSDVDTIRQEVKHLIDILQKTGICIQSGS